MCLSRRVLGLRGAGILLSMLLAAGCEAGQPSAPPGSANLADRKNQEASGNFKASRMWMTIGEKRFAVTLTDSAAAHAFAALLPLALDMEELNGNEKYARLSGALPANATRPGTIRNGDLMLYGADTLVIFYSAFRSTYSYTRIGQVDDPGGLAAALGLRGVRVTFSVQ